MSEFENSDSALPYTGRVMRKKYQCGCGFVSVFSTNHWGDIYNTYCPKCMTITTWQCCEAIPKGYTLPPKWDDVIVPLANVKED